MSVNLVLPPLSAWAASRLTGILESKTQDDFNTAFNATFATQCSFNVNAKTISRDEYKAQLLQDSAAGFDESGTVVNIEGQTQVQIGNQGQLSGLVGLFYTALSDSKFLVLGAPTERRRRLLSICIEPTEKSPPNPLHIRGYFDPRRVTSVNQVVAESTYHVTIPHASVPKGTTTENSTSKVELGPGPLKISSDDLGPFGGRFGPGPVRLPRYSGVRLPPGEMGAKPETLPGDGEFGVGPVITSGETLGEIKP
ncbi:hypothetical protein L210DRAFT_3644556 [Boletus edulis BED1]|uniref:Uncharacterized protein n=1 Tax=Boletus edulis BED1 TaxID=1328754 RepID=A0AAD4GHC8_BOLED|nr:hypothetical protein L210DRAFT_3644556 [Boletus edulis BED1]